MRASALLALAVVTMLAPLPSAAAAGSTELALTLPEGVIVGGTDVPVTLKLTLRDFACYEARSFVIELATRTSEGVKAMFESTTVELPVEARTYFVDTYTAETSVDLAVRAIRPGDAKLVASFAADAGPCVSPGGFQPAVAEVSRKVVAGTQPEAAPEEPTGPTPEGRPAPAEPTTPASPTGPTAPRPKPREGCAPETQCGFIGDYASEGGSNDTPAPAAALVLGSLVFAAVALRRKK